MISVASAAAPHKPHAQGILCITAILGFIQVHNEAIKDQVSAFFAVQNRTSRKPAAWYKRLVQVLLAL